MSKNPNEFYSLEDKEAMADELKDQVQEPSLQDEIDADKASFTEAMEYHAMEPHGEPSAVQGGPQPNCPECNDVGCVYCEDLPPTPSEPEGGESKPRCNHTFLRPTDTGWRCAHCGETDVDDGARPGTPPEPAAPKCADNDPLRDCQCGGERGKPSCMFPGKPAASPEPLSNIEKFCSDVERAIMRGDHLPGWLDQAMILLRQQEAELAKRSPEGEK